MPLVLWHGLLKLPAGLWLLHLTNVTLHGIVAGMTGVLGLKMGWGRAWALFASVWLVVQPSAVEAVAWASGVQDLLMTVSVVCAVVLMGSRIRFRAAVLVVLLLAALLSKETAVAAPALLAVFWMGGSREGVRRHRRYVLLAVGVVGAYVALRFFVAAPPGDYARVPSGYLVKEAIVRPFASLAPWHEHTIADYPALGIGLASFPLLLLVVAALRSRAGSLLRVLRFAAWVLIAIGPVYGYFFISEHLEGSRYLYLATPAWVLLLTELLRSTLGTRIRWPAAGAMAIVVLLSAGGVVVNLRPWIAAATLRDAVLREARATSSAAECRAFAFEGVPGSFDGAYVFRNGFDEALGRLPTSQSGPECIFRWNGRQFVRADATALNSASGS